MLASQAILSLVVLVALPRHLEERETLALLQRLQAVADVAAFDVAAAHALDDTGRIRAILKATVDVPDLVYAAYVGAHGQVVQEQWTTRSPREATVPTAWLDEVSPDGEWVQLRFPVRHRGRDLGRIRLVGSTDELRAAVGRARIRTVEVAVVLLVAGGLLAWLIGTVATRRLRQISATAEAVAAGCRERRADVHGGPGDVDTLARSFNRMVEGLVEAREEVVAAHAGVARIMDHMPVSLAVFDEDLRCVALNKAALPDPSLRGEALGHSLEHLLTLSGDPEAGRRFQAHLEEARRRWSVVEREEVVRHRDVGERQLLLRIVALAEDADRRRFVVCGLDITNLRQAQTALASRERELRQAQKMEAVGRLAGGIAHDFNNLLTVIGGHADLLSLDLAEGSDEQGAAEEIREAAARATDLVRQLLIFSRREEDEPGAVEVGRSLDDIVRLVRRIVGEEVTLRVRPSPGLPPVLLGPGRLQQVVMNLVLNARDAMPEGGDLLLTTGVSLRPLPDGSGHRPEVHITVSDTGHGMAPELVAKIFEPFFTTKDVGRGTGLGLSTVYGIVQQGGGQVAVATAPGAGTCFDVTLPACTAEVDVSPPETETPSSWSTWPGDRPPRVLLAEDDPAVRSFLERQLVAAGCAVTATGDPAEALTLGVEEPAPDVVISDVIMPEMTGPELVARLRTSRPELPALFITGYEHDHLERLPLSGGDILLRKPFSPAHFLQALRTRLEPDEDTLPAAAVAG
jgi:signal transduction histidine kinase/ActR/RegA family two-component response regulator/HAMP domain-containing protein